MSKRKRSRKSSAARRRQAQAARVSAVKAGQTTKPSSSSTRGKEVDFAAEYHYVMSDLKRFALLAVAMFATLIVLALVIR